MTPEQTFEKYRSMVVANGATEIIRSLGKKLKALPLDQQKAYFCSDRQAGTFWLFRDPSVPGYVMEVVLSREHGDTISGVYGDCAFNATVGELRNMRAELIDALVERINLGRESIGIADEGRGNGRMLAPEELATGQLIDLLDSGISSAGIQATAIDKPGFDLSVPQS